MKECGTGPKGITVSAPISVAQNSYAFPACHKYGFEWPEVPGNPSCMVEPDPEPSRCPELCAPAAMAEAVSKDPCTSCAQVPREWPPCPLAAAACGNPAACSPPPCAPWQSSLPSNARRAHLVPYDYHTTVYQTDYCAPPCVRARSVIPCPKGEIPLGKSCGTIREYVGKCGGGPIKPPMRRLYGIMGPPPKKYSFGRTEYQTKVGRLGGALLKLHSKKPIDCLVPYGTAPPCRAPVKPPCRPPCAPEPCVPCPGNNPCALSVYLCPCACCAPCRPR